MGKLGHKNEAEENPPAQRDEATPSFPDGAEQTQGGAQEAPEYLELDDATIHRDVLAQPVMAVALANGGEPELVVAGSDGLRGSYEGEGTTEGTAAAKELFRVAAAFHTERMRHRGNGADGAPAAGQTPEERS